MTVCQKATKPLARCLKSAQPLHQSAKAIRSFTSSSRSNDVEATPAAPAPTETVLSAPIYDANTVTSNRGEKALMKMGIMPIGSRRRRAAIGSSDNIPFEQLPYQCFQEARKVLQKDREEKLELIAKERLRISNLVAMNPDNIKGGAVQKERKLDSMRRYLEYLKIQADMNDPMIKKRFEDGDGDMNKPIYRYLADRKWRSYQRPLIVQRIEQFGVIPDALSHFEPTAEVRLAFRTRTVQPGEFIDSRVSEVPARLNVQVFDKGERLVSVVVIDGDVPSLDNDNFSSRCHYLAVNIPLGPTKTSLPLAHATKEQSILPWLPPFAQKGTPYHRYSVFVIQQKPNQVLKREDLAKKYVRDDFNLRSFVQSLDLTPIGVHIFRAEWDEGTAGVMQRAGIEGADVEFKKLRIPALKPKEKARGWEARHASGKYLSLRRGRPLLRRTKYD